MSEEITESMVTPERSVSPRHLHSTHLRASVRGSFHAGNKATRSSTGKSRSADSIRSANSRYLRASTGSCHDFCKFGHRHLSEEKTRVPLHRKLSKPSPVKVNPFRATSEEQKKVAVLNHEPPSNAKTRSTPYKKSELPKPKTSLDKEKAIKQKPSTESINDHRKPKTSSDVKTPFRRQTSTRLPKNIPSSTKKVSSPEPPEMIKSVIFPSESVEAKMKCGPSSASEIPRYGRQKASPSVKSNPVKVKRPVRSEKSDVVRGATGQNTRRLAPPASSLIPKASLTKAGSNRLIEAGNLKLVSRPKVQNMVSGDKGNTSNDEQVFEKTLHFVKTEAENNDFDSLPDEHIIASLPPSPSMQSDEEDNKEIDYGDKSLEIGEVPFIPDVSSFPRSPKSVSRANLSLASLCPTEEVDNVIGNVGSLEMGEVLSVSHVHVVASFPSSPKSLSQAAPSPHCVEDEEEIENLSNKPGEITLSNDKSLENDNAESIKDHSDEPHKSISENDDSPKIGNTQSIPKGTKGIEYRDDGYIPENNESPERSSQEVTKGVEDSEDGYISENNVSPETLILQSIPEGAKGTEYHDNGYISENDEPRRIGILQFIPEDEKGIKSCDDGYISGNEESPEIDNERAVPDSYTIPSSPKSNTDSSLSSYDDNEDDVGYTDSEMDECITEKDENPTSNTLRSTRVVISNHNHSYPVKLKFRPGRTIDLQSENTGPRRLRFRRRRVVETENVNSETKSLKKSGGVNIEGGDEISSERIVLKHQDVQDKKDSQVLLNNVIEETASKLVESRKSKVKALVGAFETVISLQETKPGS